MSNQFADLKDHVWVDPGEEENAQTAAEIEAVEARVGVIEALGPLSTDQEVSDALAAALAGVVGTSDSRLTNARTPTAHAASHAAGQSDALTVTKDQVTGLQADLDGKVGTGDARLTDARTPTSHAASHTAGGSDALTLTQAQITGLTAALNAKMATGDPVTQAQVTGLISALNAKLDSGAAIPQSQVTGLASALASAAALQTATQTAFDNAASGLTSTNVKAAIDEVNGKFTASAVWTLVDSRVNSAGATYPTHQAGDVLVVLLYGQSGVAHSGGNFNWGVQTWVGSGEAVVGYQLATSSSESGLNCWGGSYVQCLMLSFRPPAGYAVSSLSFNDEGTDHTRDVATAVGANTLALLMSFAENSTPVAWNNPAGWTQGADYAGSSTKNQRVIYKTVSGSFPVVTDFLPVAASGGKKLNAVYAQVVLSSPPNTQTGTAYTLALTDRKTATQVGVVEMNNAAANTVTVPPNSTVAFPIGSELEICQIGAGVTSIAAGAGVTIDKQGVYSLVMPSRYGRFFLRKRATDEWVLSAHQTVADPLTALCSADTGFGAGSFTDIAGLSLDLGIGSWRVDYRVLVTSGANRTFMTKLYSGSTIYDETEDTQVTNGWRTSSCGWGEITLAAPATLKVACSGDGAGTVVRDGGGSTSHTVTKLTARRVG